MNDEEVKEYLQLGAVVSTSVFWASMYGWLLTYPDPLFAQFFKSHFAHFLFFTAFALPMGFGMTAVSWLAWDKLHKIVR